jgi:hypothetical protein
MAIAATTTGATVRFEQNATLGAMSMAAGGYNVAFLGTQTTVAAAVSFLNTGTVTLGDDASDSTRFSGGVTTTAATGGTRIAGAIATSGAAMNLGTVTMTADASLDSGGGAIAVGARRRLRTGVDGRERRDGTRAFPGHGRGPVGHRGER